MNGLEIAIIGVGLRFPSASDLDELWDIFINSRNCITFFSDEELIKAGMPECIVNSGSFVKAKGFISDAEYFDNEFFSYSTKETQLIEPQERLLYECSWEALEHAGIVQEKNNEPIGIYLGCHNNIVWPLKNIFENGEASRGDLNQFDDKDFIATRLAYKLNLTGPAISVQSACSTSLVAIHLACRAILSGECSMALAGGASIKLPLKDGHFYSDGGVYSKDGNLKPFDMEASGIVEGDGVGMVLLKRLEDAISDGDIIHAVIKGSAVNNDGSLKPGYYSPSVSGQVRVIQDSFINAELSSHDSISFIECHGTATKMGDQIEVEALKQFYNNNNSNKDIVLGSSKANFGHTAAAAGVLSLIKGLLIIKHRKIPKMPNYAKLNPNIDLDNSPFFINGETIDLNNKSIIRGGISSFGIGGTNAHVILEEHKTHARENTVQDNEEERLIIITAKSKNSLSNLLKKYATYLDTAKHTIYDISYNLAFNRAHFNHRAAIVTNNKDELKSVLLGERKSELILGKCDYEWEQVVFMFPGQSSHYTNMGRGIYDNDSIFRKNLDQCNKYINGRYGIDILNILFNSSEDIVLNNIAISPIIIFSFEYSLAKSLIFKGIIPDVMIGHSIGEYVAACIAEVLTLEDSLMLIAERGKLMATLPKGKMVSIPLSKNELEEHLLDSIYIAADNGESCIISGSIDNVNKFIDKCSDLKLITQVLNIDIAGHSPELNLIVNNFIEILRNINFQSPKISLISNVTGELINLEITRPDYWIKQMIQTVYFNKGIETILSIGNSIFLEVGPSNTLSMIVQPKKSKYNKVVIPLVQNQFNKNDYTFMLRQIAKYWIRGGDLDWGAFFKKNEFHKIELPTYVFDKNHHPIDVSFIYDSELTNSNSNIKNNINKWFYETYWKFDRFIEPIDSKEKINNGDKNNLLVFCNYEHRDLIKNFQRSLNCIHVVCVYPGDHYQESMNTIVINPAEENHYIKLFEYLKLNSININYIIHLWLESDNRCFIDEEVEKTKILGFYCLNCIARNFTILTKLKIISLVTGLNINCNCPDKALLLGASKVIPIEYPNILCKVIDLQDKLDLINNNGRTLCEILEYEINIDDGQNLILYEGNKRKTLNYRQTIYSSDTGILMPTILIHGGTYIVTGGLGGLGLTFAKYLSKNTNGNIILLSRSKFPDEQEWERICTSFDKCHPIVCKINDLLEIKRNAKSLEIIIFDISDYDKLVECSEKLFKKHDQITGVIHCAGSFKGGMIQENTKEKYEEVFSSKVTGTLNIDKVFFNKADFIIHFSSLNAYIPMFGQINYCSANLFLEYYYNWRKDSSKTRVFVIGWDAWKEVGGAIETIKELSNNTNKKSLQREISHPILNEFYEESGFSIFKGIILSNYWCVNEHKVLGKPTLPGVGFIELCYAAFRNLTNTEQIAIEEMVVINPLIVESEIRIEVIIQNNDQHYDFIIISEEVNASDSWVINTKGRVRRDLSKSEIKNINSNADIDINYCIDAFKVSKSLGLEKTNMATDNVEFGDRWLNSSISRITNNNCMINKLKLDDKYLQDIHEYYLHPALFDHGLGVINSNKNYIPFMYSNIYILGPITKEIISYTKTNNESNNSVSYNVAITDGKDILIKVENYLLVQPQNSRTYELNNGTKHMRKYYLEQLSISNHAQEKFINDVLATGITCKEGVEIFNQVLTNQIGQVLISTTNFFSKLNDASKDSLFDDKELDINKIKSARPDQTCVFVDATSPHHIMLASTLSDLLGIEPIGIYDNFFELGANSLKIIQYCLLLRKKLGVHVEVVQMYANPCIDSLVSYLYPDSGAGGYLELADELPTEIKLTKANLKNRRQKLNGNNEVNQ